MKSNSRVLRGWRDFGVKATAVILTILLATQMVGTPAFATATMSNKQASEDIATTVNDTGVDEATTDTTVDATATDTETQTDSATDPADEASATQPTDEGTQDPTDQQAGTAGTDPADNGGSAAASGSEQDQVASINLDIAEGATVMIDGEEFASTTKQTNVAANEELKFTAAAPEGMQVSAVMTVIDNIERDPIAADENGEYTIAAENVTDALTVKIETSAIESETPSEGEEAPAEEPKEEVALGDNEYIGTGVSAIGGDVKVKVTMDGDKIAKIDVLSHNETSGISDPAFEQIPAAIIEAQSADVDVVAGATKTSEALIAAVKDALSQVK